MANRLRKLPGGDALSTIGNSANGIGTDIASPPGSLRSRFAFGVRFNVLMFATLPAFR